jgi:hypothetical protein
MLTKSAVRTHTLYAYMSMLTSLGIICSADVHWLLLVHDPQRVVHCAALLSKPVTEFST